MIVVFGTINVDLVTTVSRFPVPGETVKGPDYAAYPGGKGANQALAAARAGARVTMVGAVGADPFAAVALGGLKAAGIDCTRVGVVAARTGICMIAVGPGGENLMIGANAANDAAEAAWLDGAFRPDTVFLTQNSLGTSEVEKAVALAAAAGSRIVYNAAPAEPVAEATFAAASVVVVNEHEARRYGDLLGLTRDPRGFAVALRDRIGRDVVVTTGPDGMVAALASGAVMAARPLPVTVVDTTGAGDAFCGALAAALDRGDGIETGLRQAVAASSLACREQGAQTSFRDLAEIAAAAEAVALVAA